MRIRIYAYFALLTREFIEAIYAGIHRRKNKGMAFASIKVYFYYFIWWICDSLFWEKVNAYGE